MELLDKEQAELFGWKWTDLHQMGCIQETTALCVVTFAITTKAMYLMVTNTLISFKTEFNI